jgi:hypothetical protein
MLSNKNFDPHGSPIPNVKFWIKNTLKI